MECCPTCGGDLPIAPRPIIDEDAGFVILSGRVIKFTVSEMKIFLQLLEASPNILSRGSMTDNLYITDADVSISGDKIIDIFIMKIRQKIKGSGIKIITHWGRGFQLIYLG